MGKQAGGQCDTALHAQTGAQLLPADAATESRPASDTGSAGVKRTPSHLSPAGLVAIDPAEYLVEVDLAYAGSNNFVCLPIYAADAPCMLHADAAACLKRAALAAWRAGLGLKILDAYRPPAAQEVLWRICPDPAYVADPAQGSNHSRGVAVDVALLGEDGRQLDMGTGFDDMRELSHHDRPDLPAAVQRNRHLLLGIMLQAGFVSLPTEWWHYELPGAAAYPLLDEAGVLLIDRRL